MNTKQKSVFTYTLLHFLVDFTTIFFISKALLGPTMVGIVNRAYVIIVYNLLAFAGQLPMGMISDMIGKNRTVTAVGCVLAGMAFPVSLFSPWLGCIFAAVGDGAFHIGAGSDILQMSMPKAGLSGLFVSSGALGVWLAYKVKSFGFMYICPVIMIISAVYLLASAKKQGCAEKVEIRYNKPSFTIFLAVSCFMLTIVIRSLIGSVMDFTWKSVPALSFAFVLGVAGGKAAGGFLGDRFGQIKTAAVSLIVSLIAFVFAFDYPFTGIIGVFCFNMTMPLTLTAIAGVCNKKYGFAFGLTTFALAIGFIPVVFGAGRLFGIWMLIWSVLVSLIFLVLGLVLKNRAEKGGI